MAESILTNLPDRPLSGASLMKESVAGRKTRFVLDTSIAYVSFTVSAGSRVTLNFNLAMFPPDLPSANRGVENLVSWDDGVAWPYGDFFIDNDEDSNYLLPGGASLSADQLLVKAIRYDTRYTGTYSGSTKYSATTRFNVINDGASPHTIYFYGRYKLIIYGEELI